MRKWWIVLASLTAAILVLTGGLLAAVSLSGEEPVVARPTPTSDPVRTPLFTPPAAPVGTPTEAGLRAALARALAVPALGGRVSLSVVDVETGQPLLEVDATRQVVPASTAKIVTAIAALQVLPADLRLTTKVLDAGGGDVVLVGGGDPTLLAPGMTSRYPKAARLADLAAQLTRGRHVVRRVLVDDRLFVGPRLGPGWKPSYVTSADVAPVSALELSGREPADPALDTGRQLAKLLRVTTVARGTAPSGAPELGSVSSAPVPDLVESMLATSDNDLAEALGRHVALASGQPASFDGVAAAFTQALQPLVQAAGIDPAAFALRDASGLSTADRLQTGAMARLLAHAARDQRFAALLSALPVAGFDGTLANRFRSGAATPGAGQVRAKTGSLTGVSALAGFVRTRAGRLLAFDITADGLPAGGPGGAPAALDVVASVLATCTCR